jgi:alkaline phosphatase
MNINIGFVVIGLCLLLLVGCAQPELMKNKPIKNVILLIGDGMGPQQLGLLLEYAQRGNNPVYRQQGGLTAFDHFAREGYIGLSMHSPADALVTDSACSASQLASGISSGSEMIGLDNLGNPVMTVLEQAKRQGKATGLVSDTRITHATPAAFAAHQRHRSLENEIALEMLASRNVDVMLSGGLRHWIPRTVNTDVQVRQAFSERINEHGIKLYSKREDDQDLLAIAEQQGYQLVFNRAQLQRANSGKLLGLFAGSAMQDAIDYHRVGGNQPSLAQMTRKALTLLADDPNGFFLMVEGGQIDWAGHNNDAGTLLHEMVRFEETVAAVYEWVSQREDTLVLITADHETGGFGFSYSRYQTPAAKKLPGKMFYDHEYRPNFNFGDPGIPDRLYAQQKSFYQIWQGTIQEKAKPNARKLMTAVNANTDFTISLQQAESIIATEINEYQVADHTYLGAKHFPAVQDFKEFYVYGDDVHLDLIGRALAKQQNVVWSTGAHTHTPVPVIAWGPENLARRFSTLTHHTQIGQWLMAIVGNN